MCGSCGSCHLNIAYLATPPLVSIGPVQSGFVSLIIADLLEVNALKLGKLSLKLSNSLVLPIAAAHVAHSNLESH
jgi:hypothetical protein